MRNIIFILLSLFSITSYGQHHKSINEIKKTIENTYIGFCNQMNKQLPLKIDELTTLKNITYYNWTITASYSIDYDFSEIDCITIKDFLKEVKLEQKKNIERMFKFGEYNFTQKEMQKFYITTGMKFLLKYYDMNGLFIGTIQYDYKDFYENKKNGE